MIEREAEIFRIVDAVVRGETTPADAATVLSLMQMRAADAAERAGVQEAIKKLAPHDRDWALGLCAWFACQKGWGEFDDARWGRVPEWLKPHI